MAETGVGPLQLLEVCGQRLARFLRDAEHKRLAWLREVEEQGLRMLESDFGAEPELMAKTPSQRRRPRKRQSSCLKDENKEPNRRRSSRRRSSTKPVFSKLSSQRRQSREQPRVDGRPPEEVAVPNCLRSSWADAGTELSAPPEAPDPAAETGLQDCPQAAASSDATVTEQQLPEWDAATELRDTSPAALVPADRTGRDEEEAPKERVSTSTPKASRSRDPAVLGGNWSPQGLEKVFFQDSGSKATAARSKPRCSSGCRSFAGGPHKSRRASLAEKYSLAGKRESMIQRSISKAMSKKAGAQESSSASSRVSRQNSLEVFVEEDVTSRTRPSPELNQPSEKAPEDILISSRSAQASSPPAQHFPPPEQQPGSSEGSRVNPNNKPQNENQEQPHCAKARENPSRIWTRSCKQAVGAIWSVAQPGGRTPSPLDEKPKNSANQTPPSSLSASKVVRPLKNFLQAVQRNQLLPSPGPTGRGGVIKNFIKCSTPTRPNVKGDFVEKERQRLESLRKKQEAEEQRRKKVEEEKKRRQAEMKQKREERLRKALQARERVEQMEEEKKKRVEQKILQNDEKARLSQAREEKVAEERSKKKLSKKHGEADAWKQKAPRVEEDEFEPQEPLQKRRDDEVKEKGGKRVLELKRLVEQQQVEQMKERDHKQRWKEKPPQPQLKSAVFTEKNIKEEEKPKELHQLPGQEKRTKQPESIAVASGPWLKEVKEEDGLQELLQQPGEEGEIAQPEASTAASGTWLSKAVTLCPECVIGAIPQGSVSLPCLGPPKGTKLSGNNYGMDLNSDDSTDDENDPRKPVPAWADGSQLRQAITYQYYHPVNVDQIFGLIRSPKLEDIFGKSKPRYFKRTSSAVWHSPPDSKSTCDLNCSFKN